MTAKWLLWCLLFVAVIPPTKLFIFGPEDDNGKTTVSGENHGMYRNYQLSDGRCGGWVCRLITALTDCTENPQVMSKVFSFKSDLDQNTTVQRFQVLNISRLSLV